MSIQNNFFHAPKEVFMGYDRDNKPQFLKVREYIIHAPQNMPANIPTSRKGWYVLEMKTKKGSRFQEVKATYRGANGEVIVYGLPGDCKWERANV